MRVMMSGMLDRVEVGAGGPSLRDGGVTVSEVLGRLEAGEAPDRVAGSLGLGAADMIAALAFAALGAGDDDGPPLVQGRPKRPRLEPALRPEALGRLLPRASRPASSALAAGLLQVHDFWDASHEAAQQADDLGERSVSAYWHGIAHRREPDPGNASYWFRRVGRHPIFGPLWEAARPLVEAQGDRILIGRLGRGDSWNSSAMIDLCASARPGSPAEALALRLQRLEMVALLDATLPLVGPGG